MTKKLSNKEIINRRRATLVTLLVGVALVVTGFVLEPPAIVLQGEWQILTAPSILITDFIAVGGIGAAFLNAGLNTLISLALAWLIGARFNGFFFAGIFIVTGFSFFGKTPFNMFPIYTGVYLYDRFLASKRSPNLIASMLFATSLGPVVSQAAFGFGWGWAGIPAGIALGLLVGLMIGGLSGHVATFHYGFNLYNTGTTAGLVGTGLYMMMRAFGLEIASVFHWSTEYTGFLAVYMAVMLAAFIPLGFLWGAKLSTFLPIIKRSGRNPTDFTESDGLGSTLVSMGLSALISLGYILLIGGDINGAILAGIFTVLGFGAIGKQPANIIPVIAGVYLISLPSKWAASDPGPMLAALFGTALAPFCGRFGPLAGILAGALHMPMLMHVGALHGYMNLYNNGFAAGLVMLLLIGIIKGIKPELLVEEFPKSQKDGMKKKKDKKKT